MQGIYFINERWQAGNLTKEESIYLQKHALQAYLKDNQINAVTLNPTQLNNFYTIPHALLHDLKQHSRIHLDCLILFSEDAIADFIYSYPARWIRLKSYFDEVLFVEQALVRKAI
ncbi:hypothetical protein J2Z40_002047 [Cytobacillus eiseniae]|uniref:Uncharacterized protein n=1 Tax=Cytobacillus eiseniae TaxID=762947 RepID=A0ABS4RGM9_9BACI|nr:hypothetical protein [Cytobacillus eiseniae]MBP2241484.1 hypothetical protein [Cytobacillus eiseniae]